jgi:hypothetical protein
MQQQNLWWAAGYDMIAFPIAAGILSSYRSNVKGPEAKSYNEELCELNNMESLARLHNQMGSERGL